MLHFPIVERCNEAGAQTLVHHRQQYEHRNEGFVDDAVEVDPPLPVPSCRTSGVRDNAVASALTSCPDSALKEQAFECRSHLLRKPTWLTGLAVHIDVYEVSLCSGDFIIVAEETNLVADATVAEPGDTQTSMPALGGGRGSGGSALGR